MDLINIKVGNLELLDILNNDNVYRYMITSDMGSVFKYGVCVCDCLEIELNNTDSRFENVGFRTKTVQFNKNGSTKTFYIDDLQKESGKIKITAYDKMCKLEKTFKYKQVKTPITLKSLMENTLTQCDISYNLSSFSNQNYVIHNISELKDKTCRQVIEYCLDLAGANAIINSEEIFELTKFKTVRQYIELDTVKTFTINDEITHQVNNVLYKRSDMEFSKTDGNNRCISLSANNPLLKICSTNKVQQILDNIDAYYIFLPCEIEILSSDNYIVGDYLSLTYEDKEYLFYVNKIIDENNNNRKITCVSTLTDEEAAGEMSEGSYSSGVVEFFYTDELTEINLQDCSNSTKIYYSITFNSTNNGYFNIRVNDKHNRQFIYKEGNNTISSVLNYKFSDSINTFTIEDLDINNIDDYSLSILYKDCLIVDDIDESDYPDNEQIEEDTEDVEIIESKYINNIYSLMTLNKDARLAVSQDFFKAIPSKAGTEELVVNAEHCKVYYKYLDVETKLVFEGKYNNRITMTEKDMKEIVIKENSALEKKHYIFKAPIKLGEILEYKKPFITDAEGKRTQLERLKIIDDGVNVIYSDHVLVNLNFTSGAWNWGDNWELVLTTGHKVPELAVDTVIYGGTRILYATHYANGTIDSVIDGGVITQGYATWLKNNTVGTQGVLIHSNNDIDYYKINMDSHYYGYTFDITDAAVEIEKEQNTNFYTMCAYSRIPTSETNLLYPTT